MCCALFLFLPFTCFVAGTRAVVDIWSRATGVMAAQAAGWYGISPEYVAPHGRTRGELGSGTCALVVGRFHVIAHLGTDRPSCTLYGGVRG